MSSDGGVARVTVVFYHHSGRWDHREFVEESEAERFTGAMDRYGVPTEVRFCPYGQSRVVVAEALSELAQGSSR